jgi:nucleoside-diphosphate-sugar epimerase
MQTILGSTGIIGTELAKALATYTNEIRLVSRHPQKVNEKDELVIANLLDAEETAVAVKGSSIVYLCAGLIYKYSIWKKEWPVIMKNVIAACIQHKAKLVFFDNVYAYGPVEGAMKENTVFQPTSKKGQVRAEIANMILAAIQKGDLTALIARAPEFYGPGKTNSGVNATVFDNIKKGK